MKALVLKEYKRLVVEDVSVGPLGAGEVRIRVRACGICGSDIHGYDGSTGRRRPPLVMGHEAAGEIAELAPDIAGYRIGDRVTFDSTISCGRCGFCRLGRINLCDNRRVLGVSCGEYRQDGAFAEFVTVPARILYRLPDAVSFEHAAMVEAISIAVHAVSRSPQPLGKSAAVIGAGMIGLLLIQAARAAGFGRIIAVDVDPDRLLLARTLGADETILAGGGDPAAAVRERTGGRGAEVVFEVVGSPDTLTTAVQSAYAPGAAAAAIGCHARNLAAGLLRLVRRVSSVPGSAGWRRDPRRTPDLGRGPAGRWARLVRPLVRPRKRSDEGYSGSIILTRMMR